jgi:hypothetical protein
MNRKTGNKLFGSSEILKNSRLANPQLSSTYYLTKWLCYMLADWFLDYLIMLFQLQRLQHVERDENMIMNDD